jgi:hypothetical protein
MNFIYLCTYDLYSPVHNILDACISITRAEGKWEGVGLWISTVFWVPKTEYVSFHGPLFQVRIHSKISPSVVWKMWTIFFLHVKPIFLIEQEQSIHAYILTSGFWPRVRARALRAPVFLGIAMPIGALRAPTCPSQLRCSPPK